MEQMDTAGGIANAKIILHAPAARAVIHSLDSAAAIIDDFHAPLGIASSREKLSITPWRQALHDARQLKKAAAELGEKTAIVAATLALVGAGAKNLPQRKD